MLIVKMLNAQCWNESCGLRIHFRSSKSKYDSLFPAPSWLICHNMNHTPTCHSMNHNAWSTYLLSLSHKIMKVINLYGLYIYDTNPVIVTHKLRTLWRKDLVGNEISFLYVVNKSLTVCFQMLVTVLRWFS